MHACMQPLANPTNTNAVANAVANSQGGSVQSVSSANSAAFSSATNAIATAISQAVSQVELLRAQAISDILSGIDTPKLRIVRNTIVHDDGLVPEDSQLVHPNRDHTDSMCARGMDRCDCIVPF